MAGVQKHPGKSINPTVSWHLEMDTKVINCTSSKSTCHMAVMSLSSETLMVMVYLVQAISNCLWKTSWFLKEDNQVLDSCQSRFVKVFEGGDG